MTNVLDQVMALVYQQGDWRNLTKQMTPEQREAAAAAVNRAGIDRPMVRWWTLPRPDFRQALAERGVKVEPVTAEELAAVEAWLDEGDHMVNKRNGGRPIDLPAPDISLTWRG